MIGHLLLAVLAYPVFYGVGKGMFLLMAFIPEKLAMWVVFGVPILLAALYAGYFGFDCLQRQGIILDFDEYAVYEGPIPGAYIELGKNYLFLWICGFLYCGYKGFDKGIGGIL